MGRRRDSESSRVARAFAPGHVTGFFSPRLEARDPRGRGSIGAGVVLELGAHATARWTETGAARVDVVGEDGHELPISSEVARRLFVDGRGHLEVELRHELPIGQGFGMSAAGALATGLAVGGLLGRSHARIVEVAHLAELFGGGGLGGVAAILGGGLERRTRPGIPPWGRILRRTVEATIFVGTAGAPIDSSRWLNDAGKLARLRDAAEQAQVGGGEKLTWEEFLARSERFTDTVRLGGPGFHRLIGELRATGASVAQAMFGHSFFAVPSSPAGRRRMIDLLESRPVRALEIRSAVSGGSATKASYPPPG